MKRWMMFGLGGLFLTSSLLGCGGEEKAGGNPDAAAVIGTSPEDPNYGAASADLMLKMHGDPSKKAETKKDEAKAPE